ncbi:MAG: four helix bundle protein [Bacteroidetes bacterium]|nr:four helix bundle protein [Bacteroidota bacterium]
MDRIELENRLIEFAVNANHTAVKYGGQKNLKSLGDQLVRSSTSVALNYAEARGAESTRDFIHKMRIVLKELRESHVCLKLIERIANGVDKETMEQLINENDELVAIFVASVKTSEAKLQNSQSSNRIE